MDNEEKVYQKIAFWGNLIGNLFWTAMIFAGGIFLFFSTFSLLAGNSLSDTLMMCLFTMIVIIFCLPAIKLKRSAKIAINLYYQNGDSTPDQLLENIPLTLKWISKEREYMKEEEKILLYAKYLKYYAFSIPFLFVVWVYGMNILVKLFL